jgi:hypothetical protein
MTQEDFLRWRFIEPCNMCETCQGAGKIVYPDTSTYYRFTTTQDQLTVGVCDACWGSGDKTDVWTDLRLY